MRNLVAIFVLLCLLGCQKKPKPAEVEMHLKKAMSEFLFNSANKDTSSVKFNVKEVLYFEDVEFYECEFNVAMKQNGKDTVGVMKARVTKDFSNVTRKL